MNMKNMKLFLSMLIALSLVLAFTGCADTGSYVEIPTEPVEELAVNTRSAILAVGDTLPLGVTGGAEEVSFASSDPEVASVDTNGMVTALKKGHAMITAKSGDMSVCCGILVEPAGEMWDLTKLQPNAVFSNVQLFHQNEMVNFAADGENGAFYFSQQYGHKLPSDAIITKVEQVDGVWQRTEFVHLYNHGFGYFDVENKDGEVYLLSESNGPFTNQGTTVSRVIWEDGVMYDEEFGDTFVLPGLEGSPRPRSDEGNDLIVMYEFCGRESYYTVYDRSALLSGEENNYLHRFACVSRQTPVNGGDDSGGRYNSAIRGFAVKDGYIYQISGNGSIYISVFDFNGQLQYCHEVEGYEDLAGRAPVGISFDGDDLYIAVNSNVNTTVYYANVWKLEEVAQ